MLAVLVIATTTFSGCQKGDAGPAGANGTNGTNGTNGVANISVQTVSVNNWTDLNGNGSLWVATITDSALTLAVNNSGTVQVFFSTNGVAWLAMPFTYVGAANYFMSYWTGPGSITIDWAYNLGSGGSNPNVVYSATAQFKIAIIPPAMRRHDVDYTNYASIKEAYNLQD